MRYPNQLEKTACICDRWLCDGNAGNILYIVVQDVENDEAKLASAKSIQALQVEISALRTEIQALVQRDLGQ